MSRIAVDTERLENNAKQLDAVVTLAKDALAPSALPRSLDAGEGSEPICDVITRVTSLIDPLGSSYAMIAEILRDIADETITNEEKISSELWKIADAVGPL